MKHQYYLHTNGSLIHKPIDALVDLGSDFVKAVWILNPANRGSAWEICIEAAGMGANIERIKELAEKWGLTFDDSVNYLAYQHTIAPPSELMKTGLAIFVTETLGYKGLDEYLDAALTAGNAKQMKQRGNEVKHCTNPNHDETPQKDCTECMWDMNEWESCSLCVRT